MVLACVVDTNCLPCLSRFVERTVKRLAVPGYAAKSLGVTPAWWLFMVTACVVKMFSTSGGALPRNLLELAPGVRDSGILIFSLSKGEESTPCWPAARVSTSSWPRHVPHKGHLQGREDVSAWQQRAQSDGANNLSTTYHSPLPAAVTASSKMILAV